MGSSSRITLLFTFLICFPTLSKPLTNEKLHREKLNGNFLGGLADQVMMFYSFFQILFSITRKNFFTLHNQESISICFPRIIENTIYKNLKHNIKKTISLYKKNFLYKIRQGNSIILTELIP